MHSAMFDSARVRGALRCYDAIDRVEDRAVVFLARSSLWVKSERSRRRQRLCFHFFFNTSPSSGNKLRARSREKKPVELNQTALLVGDIYSDLRVDLAMTGAINVRFFFGPFYKRVARGAFSLTLTCRTILPLSFGGDFQCIHVYPSSWARARLEFVQWSSWRRSFPKMLWRTSPKQSRDNRQQQVTVFRAKMRAVIRFNSRRNWVIARPWRGETTALLFFVVHLSDLRVRSHRSHCLSQAFFFLAPRGTKRKEFPAVWLTAQRMRRVLTPRTRAESNIAQCIDASLPPPLFFFIPLPPNCTKTCRNKLRIFFLFVSFHSANCLSLGDLVQRCLGQPVDVLAPWPSAAVIPRPRRLSTAVHFQSVERRVQRNLEGLANVRFDTDELPGCRAATLTFFIFYFFLF